MAAGLPAIPDSHLEKRWSKECRKAERCGNEVWKPVELRRHGREFAETLPGPPCFR